MEQPRFHSPALAHLEAHYEARPNEKFNGEASVTIHTAANLRVEVEGVAREIRRLVADENYRYRILRFFFVTGKLLRCNADSIYRL